MKSFSDCGISLNSSVGLPRSHHGLELQSQSTGHLLHLVRVRGAVQGGVGGVPAEHQSMWTDAIHHLEAVTGLDCPTQSNPGVLVVVGRHHLLHHFVDVGVATLNQTIGIRSVGSSRSHPDAVDVAEGLQVLVEELLPPVRLDILGGSKVFDPLKHQSLHHSLSLLVLDVSCSLELCKNIHNV